jgi:photosystem II stability/assembly factor-like uncharacterized protein
VNNPLIKKLAAAALALVLLACIPNDGAWAVDAAQPQAAAKAVTKAPMLAVTRAGNRLVAVGDYGIVLLSDNEGKTWRQAHSPATQTMLTSVWFLNDKLGWAVGHGGVVLQSLDGGEDWHVQHTAATDLALLSVWFGNEQHGIAVGSFGRAIETLDGGKSWREMVLGQGEDRDRHLNQIFPGNGETLFVAAEAGTVFRSKDSGRTWKSLKPAYKGSFWNGMMLRDGAILILGMRGNAFRSEDNGDSWQQVSTGTTQALSGISQLGDGRVLLVGMSGTVLVSKDSGRSFEGRMREDRLNLTSVAGASDGGVLLLGQSGLVRDVLKP